MLSSSLVNNAVAHYLSTGRHDELRYGTSYDDLTRAHTELEDALVAEVQRRAHGRRGPRVPKGFDPVPFARAKLSPMVRGLFPSAEQEIVLSVRERSVVFVTRQNIERLLRHVGLSVRGPSRTSTSAWSAPSCSPPRRRGWLASAST